MNNDSFFNSSNFDREPRRRQVRSKNAWLVLPFWLASLVFGFANGLFSFSSGLFQAVVTSLMILLFGCVCLWIVVMWNRKTDLYNGDAFTVQPFLFGEVDLSKVVSATISFPNEHSPLLPKIISIVFSLNDGMTKQSLIPVTDDDVFSMRKRMYENLKNSGIEVQIVDSN